LRAARSPRRDRGRRGGRHLSGEGRSHVAGDLPGGLPALARARGAARSCVLVELLAPRDGISRMKPEAVVIFGATSAIAMRLARALAPRGARLHLVARDTAKLAAVRDDLLARGATSVTTAIADLDHVEEHARLVGEAA